MDEAHVVRREQQPRLTAVAEKTLPAKCKPDSLAYCPTVDLVALATQDEQLHVFRLNGQKIFRGVRFVVAIRTLMMMRKMRRIGKGGIRKVKWKDGW
jgi:hypothetical protein